MIKRILATIFLVACLMFSNECMTAYANVSEDMEATTKTTIEFGYRFVSVDKIAIARYYGNAKDLVIPSEIDGYEVVVIDQGVFKDCDTLVTVTCPDTLIDIYSSAFVDCDNLETIILPDGMEEIRDWAFERCVSLKNIKLPSSLYYLGDGAFSDCSSLESIDLSKLSITNINARMFWGCSSLKKVSLPKKLETIEFGAFHECTSLNKITFPSSLTEIKNLAFEDCDSLKKIDLSKTGITELSERVFSGCGTMTSIVLPSGLTKIGYAALDGCYELKALDLSHTSVSTIDGHGVFHCNSLKSIKLPKTLQTIGEAAFSHCESVKTIDFSGTKLSQIGKSAFRDCIALEEVKFPATLTYVGYDAFGFCEALKEVDFSKSPTLQIDKCAFEFCQSLKMINLFNISELSIEDMAFTRCDYLEEIFLPSKIKTLGTDAFSGGFWGNRTLVITDLTVSQLNYVEELKIDTPPTPWGSRRITVTDEYYFIKFSGNGAGDTGLDKMFCATGNSYTLPKNKLTRDGYTFEGWNTRKDGSGRAYKDGASIKNLTSTKGKTATLYAQWKPIKYHVKFNGNGADSGSMKSITNIKYDKAFTLRANTFKKKGYTFAGWNTKPDGSGKSYKDAAKVKNLSSVNGKKITLYAQWTPIKYSIKFNGNGADSGSMKALTSRKYGTVYTLSANTFKKAGYKFVGWNTKADGSGKSYDNKDKIKNLSSVNGKKVTLYAQWKKVKYSITYSLNDGTNNKDNKTAYYVTTGTFKLKNPTREGYVFKGWYTDKNFKNKITKVSKGSTGNLKLYAKWVKK